MEGSSNNLMITQVQSVVSTQVETDDIKILQALNLNLQVKVHNLETDVDRLKKEVQAYKGKSNVYESLTKDLATLRKQFDKTAVALLQKCEAYEILKKEVAALKAKAHSSPRGVATPIRPKTTLGQKVIPVGQQLRMPLFRNPEDTDYSSDDEISFLDRMSTRGRPSMGSCGNIANQIAAEEAMPSRMKAYAAPTAPLRNRILMKLHSIKSASTESLESTGRKSLRKEQASVKPTKPAQPTVPAKKPRTNVKNQREDPPKLGCGGSAKATPAPAYRPALGPSNSIGQRMVRISNLASVKRSNSNCSTASAKSSSSRPAFRF